MVTPGEQEEPPQEPLQETPSVLSGDVWKLRRRLDYIVIPTNVGWRKDGSNIMGRGLAQQAAAKHHDLPRWYGAFCRQHGNNTAVMAHPIYRLVLFPTKGLDSARPWLSWKNKATLPRIQYSLDELVRLIPHLDLGSDGRVLLPAVGCGNGGLAPLEVVPLLGRCQTREPRVTLVLDAPAVLHLPCLSCAGTGLDQATGSAQTTCSTCRGTRQRGGPGLLAAFT